MLFVLARVVFSMCVDSCGWSQVHIYLYIYMGCVCEPVGSTGSGSLPADPEAAELLGITAPNRWALLCQKATNPSPKQLRSAAQGY